LDWFWRGWFYTTDYCDIALDGVRRYSIDTQNPDIEKPKDQAAEAKAPQNITVERNRKDVSKTYIEQDSAALDYYNKTNQFAVKPWEKEGYQQYLASLTEEERAIVNSGKLFYELDLVNKGGLMMPVILQFTYEDGTKEIRRIPAEIWRQNNSKITKVFMVDKPVASFQLDPYLETTDIDVSNNALPLQVPPSRFQVFKQQQAPQPNEIRDAREYEARMKEPAKGSK
jgi:hypothetical protein